MDFVLDSHLTEGSDGFVLDSRVAEFSDIQLLWDFDTAAIDETVFTVDWENPSEPVIYLKTHLTTYDNISNYRFIHFLFGLTGVRGLRPTFEINITNRHAAATYHFSWRPQYTYMVDDAGGWNSAPGFSALTSPNRVRFQFDEPFTEDTVYVADHQIYTVGRYAMLATELATDTSGLVRPTLLADENGVIGISPPESERGRPIGEHPLYGFVLGDDRPTNDGGPKRWLNVNAGHHAGEITTGWAMEGLIDYYLNDPSPEAEALRQNWYVGLWLCPTPNGTYGGHMRTNYRTGIDPNRDWSNTPALEETVMVQDAILAELGDVKPSASISLHTFSQFTAVENIYHDSNPPEAQQAWLDALNALDGRSWNRVISDIPTSIAGWHKAKGAPVTVTPEFGTRGHHTIERYRECGALFIRAVAEVDAQGLFWSIEEMQLTTPLLNISALDIEYQGAEQHEFTTPVFTVTGLDLETRGTEEVDFSTASFSVHSNPLEFISGANPELTTAEFHLQGQEIVRLAHTKHEFQRAEFKTETLSLETRGGEKTDLLTARFRLHAETMEVLPAHELRLASGEFKFIAEDIEYRAPVRGGGFYQYVQNPPNDPNRGTGFYNLT